MRFTALIPGAPAAAGMAEEYRGARAFGALRAGDAHLFIRTGLRVRFVRLGDLARVYRRVMRVPAKLCCGRGSFDVESLVLEGPSGELAQVQMPGRKAAVAALEWISARAPALETRCPDAKREAPEP